MPRFYCPTPLASGHSFELPATAARHVQVLRLQPGQEVTLFNGEGGQWRAVIERMGRSNVQVRAETFEDVERESHVRVHLAIGMPANERMDWLVEKAGELGAASIQPLVTARGILRVAGERAEKKREHWQAIAAAASEQCGRNRVTKIHEPVALGAWLDAPSSLEGDKVVLSLTGNARRVTDEARTDRKEWIALSGPEGGLEEREEKMAFDAGFAPVTLGPRVLRAETAPIALLSLLTLGSP